MQNFFKAPRESLGSLDADAAATLIANAADVALILDSDGTILDAAFQNEDLSRDLAGHNNWFGRRWVETVTEESRPKVQALLDEAASKTSSAWREINHRSTRRGDVAVLYSAIQASPSRLVAVGRDLRPIAALQQRLVEAQNSLERDYSRLRQMEMRYRILFELSSEPLLIVEAMTQRVVEANPAATRLFEASGRQVVGQSLVDLFEPAGAEAAQSLLAGVRAAGRADDVKTRLFDGIREVLLSASLLRQDNSSLFLVRIAAAHTPPTAALPALKYKLLKVVENAPDGIVITGPEGRVLLANAAFLELVHLASEDQARNEPLDRWLGRPGVDVDVLVSNLRRHGSVRLFSTTLRADYGAASTEVEVSAVSVMNGGRPCFGFAIRNVGRRLAAGSRGDVPHSVEQLKELIGRVSLRTLVRETTDVIERRAIEAALQLTGDNRASAADMLGLSRQSLYVKLRRYGMSDLSIVSEN